MEIVYYAGKKMEIYNCNSLLFCQKKITQDIIEELLYLAFEKVSENSYCLFSNFNNCNVFFIHKKNNNIQIMQIENKNKRVYEDMMKNSSDESIEKLINNIKNLELKDYDEDDLEILNEINYIIKKNNAIEYTLNLI